MHGGDVILINKCSIMCHYLQVFGDHTNHLNSSPKITHCILENTSFATYKHFSVYNFDGLVQWIRNSIALALTHRFRLPTEGVIW